MNAEGIRELNETMQKKMLETDSPAAWEGGVKSLQCSLLAEIAAQLAEANKYLKMYANPPMVFKGTNINPDEFHDFPQPITFTPMEPRATLRD
jgi:hypothetical protein